MKTMLPLVLRSSGTAARDLIMVRLHVGQLYDDNMLAYGRTEYGMSGHPLL